MRSSDSSNPYFLTPEQIESLSDKDRAIASIAENPELMRYAIFSLNESRCFDIEKDNLLRWLFKLEKEKSLNKENITAIRGSAHPSGMAATILALKDSNNIIPARYVEILHDFNYHFPDAFQALHRRGLLTKENAKAAILVIAIDALREIFSNDFYSDIIRNTADPFGMSMVLYEFRDIFNVSNPFPNDYVEILSGLPKIPPARILVRVHKKLETQTPPRRLTSSTIEAIVSDDAAPVSTIEKMRGSSYTPRLFFTEELKTSEAYDAVSSAISSMR